MDKLFWKLLYNRNCEEWSGAKNEKDAIEIFLSPINNGIAVKLPKIKGDLILSLNDIDIYHELKVGLSGEHSHSNHEFNYLQSKHDLRHDIVFNKNIRILPVEVKFIRHDIDINMLPKLIKGGNIIIPAERFWGGKAKPAQVCGPDSNQKQCEGQLITDIIRIIRTLLLHNNKYKFSLLKAIYICKTEKIYSNLRDHLYINLFKGNKGQFSIENREKDDPPSCSYWYELEWEKKHDFIEVIYPLELKGLKFQFNINFINNIIEITVRKTFAN